VGAGAGGGFSPGSPSPASAENENSFSSSRAIPNAFLGDAAGERFFASFDVLRDGAFFDAPPFVVVGFAFKRGRGDGSFARTSRRERRVVVFVVPPPPASRVAARSEEGAS
jgi:hypothetical protein